jgi:hypothetical protein
MGKVAADEVARESEEIGIAPAPVGFFRSLHVQCRIENMVGAVVRVNFR